MENNLQTDLAEFVNNNKLILNINDTIAPYVSQRKAIQKKQQELEKRIIDAIKKFEAPAVQFRDNIFCIGEKKNNEHVNAKQLRETLLKMGLETQQIDAAFKLTARPQKTRVKLVLSKNNVEQN